MSNASLLPTEEKALEYRRRYRGLIGVQSKIPIKDKAMLSLIYTPGVGDACLAVEREEMGSFTYTCRANTIALVSDGTSVYGRGAAGPLAGLPALEGKSILFKNFAGVDAFPLVLSTQDSDIYAVIDTVASVGPTFGGICLEDIAVPRSLSITEHLQRALDIPVFNNHQHAAAVVMLAALKNALKVVGKELEDIRVIVAGSGAAGLASAEMLVDQGAGEVIVCDSAGAIYPSRPGEMHWAERAIAKKTNPDKECGSLRDIIKGADAFIGFSTGSILTREMVESMAQKPIVFALANPVPEIMPEEADAGGAVVVATGRLGSPNTVNIALVFPGFFRGLLDARATEVNQGMLVAAADALAALVSPAKLGPNCVIPDILDYSVAPNIAKAVVQAALDTAVARVDVDPQEVADRTYRCIYESQAATVPPPSEKGKHGSLGEQAIDLRRRYRGVLEVKSKLVIKDTYTLGMYLPPISSRPAQIIHDDPSRVYEYTAKGNLVAVVTDGTAVLGLGNIGPQAALPVMEGKAVLFHTFAGVEAFPICLDTQDVDEIVKAVTLLSPTFGGINLEDIAAPRCFAIEEKLKAAVDIPVFHDDQHGTAVVVLAGILNALKLVGKSLSEVKVVMNGAGAAGIAVTKMLLGAGMQDIILCDTRGGIYEGRPERMNWIKEEMALVTNREKLSGSLADVLPGRDVFIGVSAPGVLTQDMIRTMAVDPIIFALANPVPEIMPDEAIAAGAKVVATGRSDRKNQVNNSLAFPGIFRGALDVRASDINEAMKIAAAKAIAGIVQESELEPEHIIPASMDFRVPPAVAAAVAQAAMDSGVARRKVDPERVAESTRRFIYEGVLDQI